MAAMARVNLSIPAPQILWLQAEAERLGISVGELVRRIIDEYRVEHFQARGTRNHPRS